MSSDDLEKSESEDSLNFDYNGIEDEILNNDGNDIKRKQSEDKNINNEVDNSELTNNEKKDENQKNNNININTINPVDNINTDENTEISNIKDIKEEINKQNIENNNNNNNNNNNSNTTTTTNNNNNNNNNINSNNNNNNSSDSTTINSNNQVHESLDEENSINKNIQDINNEINSSDENGNNTKNDNNNNDNSNIDDDNNNNDNNVNDSFAISEDEKNKLIQQNMLKECEQSQTLVNNNTVIPNKTKGDIKKLKNTDINKKLESVDGPHITKLCSNGFFTEKYKRNDNVKGDFLENVIPKALKFKKESQELYEDLSLPIIKGFNKPYPLKTYIYRMNHYKDEIVKRKEQLSSCYLLTLGHSLPLGHESRQYQSFYYTKEQSMFTSNYINTTKSKIKQNTEFYHKYIDFDYQLPSAISNLPYKTYLNFYNSDSYSPQLRRSPNKKYYFENNISHSKKNPLLKNPLLKIPAININEDSKIKNNGYKNNNKYNNNNNNKILNKKNSNEKNKISNEYNNLLNQLNILNIKNKREDVFQSPIKRIKKRNMKLQKIKEIDMIMNEQKNNIPYNSKFVLSS